jgi:hypothetical protein
MRESRSRKAFGITRHEEAIINPAWRIREIGNISKSLKYRAGTRQDLQGIGVARGEVRVIARYPTEPSAPTQGDAEGRALRALAARRRGQPTLGDRKGMTTFHLPPRARPGSAQTPAGPPTLQSLLQNSAEFPVLVCYGWREDVTRCAYGFDEHSRRAARSHPA